MEKQPCSRDLAGSRRQRGPEFTCEIHFNRLVRVVCAIKEATDTFANKEKAWRWLRSPADVIDGQAPLDLLYTDIGARTVEALLSRIAHGIAA